MQTYFDAGKKILRCQNFRRRAVALPRIEYMELKCLDIAQGSYNCSLLDCAIAQLRKGRQNRPFAGQRLAHSSPIIGRDL